MSAGQLIDRASSSTGTSGQDVPVALEVEVADHRRRWHGVSSVTRIRVDGDGVRSEGPFGATRDPWSLFTGYRATADAYELMVGRRRRFVIPRRDLAGSPGADTALSGLLSARLPRR